MSLFLVKTNVLIAQQDTINLPAVQVLGRNFLKQPVKKALSQQSYYLQQKDVRLGLRQYGGVISMVSLRGFKSEHTKLLVFEIPIEMGGMGGYDFFLVPLELFSTVSIITGKKAIVFASGGFGGIIDLGQDFRQDGYLNMQTSFSSHLGGATLLGFNINQKNLKVAVKTSKTIDLNRYHFFDPYMQDIQTEYSASFAKDHSIVGARYRLKENSFITVDLLNSDVLRSFPPPLSYQGPRRVEVEHFRQGVSSIGFVWHRYEWRIKSKIGFVNQSSDYLLKVRDSMWINIIASRWNENSWMSKLEIDNKWFMFKLLWKNQEYVFTGQKPGDVSLIANRKFLDLVVSNKALRLWKFRLQSVQKIDIVDNQLYYLFDYQVKTEGRPLISLSFSQDYNYPSLNDLYWVPGGNPLLLPEKSIELNLIGKNSFYIGQYRFWVRGEFLSARVENWILWKPTSYHYWAAENLDFVENKSAIFELGFHGYNKFFNNFKISYKFSSVVDSTGAQLIYVPEHKMLATGNLTFMGYRLEITGVCEGKRYVLMGNSDVYLAPYMVWFVSVSKTFNYRDMHFTVELDVNNAFNSNYMLVVNRPQPLRNFVLTLNLNL